MTTNISFVAGTVGLSAQAHKGFKKEICSAGLSEHSVGILESAFSVTEDPIGGEGKKVKTVISAKTQKVAIRSL
jgi:hypothetical protein